MNTDIISADPDSGAGVIPAISTPQSGSAVLFKRGDTQDEGLVFWSYDHKKPDWVTREVFEERKKRAGESYVRRRRDNPEKMRASSKRYRESHKVETAALSKAWALAHPERRKENGQKSYAANKDRLRAIRKKWEKNNREKRQGLTRARDAKIKSDPRLLTLKRLRTRLNYSVGRIKARKVITRAASREAAEFLAWLAARKGIQDFRNYHIDHLVPLSSLDFSNPKDVALANAPENVQWLTIRENYTKSDHFPSEEEIATHLRLVALWRAEINKIKY